MRLDRIVARGRISRRLFLTQLAAALPLPALAQAAPRVVVIGGGFAGATAARTLKRANPKIAVTLVEPNRTYTACPFSNLVVAGFREMSAQRFTYNATMSDGIAMLPATVTRIDTDARTITADNGTSLAYDRLVLAPGIDFAWDGLPGYNEAAVERMPHAWKAGAQTERLRRQLEAMEDGGLVIMSVPANPYRCPPGPYERASLIAHYLKARKPRSKILVLDSKDAFSKQRLFQSAWSELFPSHLEWVGLSAGGKVTAVDPGSMTLTTDFGRHKAAVTNIIPPQRAGAVAAEAGVADATGWCPINPVTFESKLVPNVHVLGDAAIAGAMPKSAFAANAQAKVCADAIVQLLADASPREPKLVNTCYSLVEPDYGISVAGVYEPTKGVLAEVAGAGGTSPLDAPREFRSREALFARAWFNTITSEVFG